MDLIPVDPTTHTEDGNVQRGWLDHLGTNNLSGGVPIDCQDYNIPGDRSPFCNFNSMDFLRLPSTDHHRVGFMYSQGPTRCFSQS